jgi:predicted AAA+ superfamily ATPase
MHLNRFVADFLPSRKIRRIIVLTGARQTGKTTLAREKFPDLRYINLDAPENREMVRNTHTALWAKNVGNAILDEAQKEPVVFDKIKYAFDEGGVSFGLLLGSSHILLLRKIKESLAGRVSVFELWPLLMGELAGEAGPDGAGPPLIDEILSGRSVDAVLEKIPSVLPASEDAPRREAEEHLLSWGGMPALLELEPGQRPGWLKDYQYTYLERDLSDLARLDDLVPFRKLQQLAALRSGGLLNYSQLARDAGVSADTARRYVEYLRISYQVFLLQPFRENLTSSVVKSPKLYWVDTGLLRRLSGRPEVLTGEIYETMVVSEIVKWTRTARKDAEIFFYRTRSGLEIDVMISTPAGVVGLEVKAGDRISPSDHRPMREAARALGKKWAGGIVVYRGAAVERLSDPALWAVPGRRLFTHSPVQIP